jgi:hypothetical protein
VQCIAAYRPTETNVMLPSLSNEEMDKMTDKPTGEQQLEALTKSANNLRQLRIQLEQAQQQHVFLLNEILDVVAENPSQLAFGIVHQKKTIAEGPLNKQTLEMLRALAAAMGHIPPGEGVGCLDRVGCANIGQLGNRCFYLCKTVKL